MKKALREAIKMAFEDSLRNIDELSDILEDNGVCGQAKTALRRVRVHTDTLVENLFKSDHKTHRAFAVSIRSELAQYRITVIDDVYDLEAVIENAFFAIFPQESGYRSF